jgi:hypothetical protein
MMKRASNIFGVGRYQAGDIPDPELFRYWEARDHLLRNELLVAIAVFVVAIGVYYSCAA